MEDKIENLLLEHMKRIQAELAASRERDGEILARLSHIESGIAKLRRDESENFAQIIEDRHSLDKLRERLERIERRLEING